VNATWDSQLQHIQEAYLGVHFFKDLYLDAGYFITHIGMESFMPKENLLSSTSIITYNEPFYQRGLRLQYSGLEHFDFQLWLLDGYNLFRDNNDSKSVGMAVSYEKGKFNASYSNIIGQELIPFDDNVLRTYHNFYITYEFYKNIFEINTSIDIGTEAPSAFFERKLMFANINTLRINLTKRLSTTFRYETQNDQNGMLTGEFLLDESIAGINIYGLTAGIGYEIQDQFYLRYEFRNLQERGNSIKVFNSEGSRNEHLVTIGWMFEHKVRIKK
jgi:hypothetical protein